MGGGASGQTPPWADNTPWADTTKAEIPWTDTPLGRHNLPWADPPLPDPSMATPADGTDPTGMYSCFKIKIDFDIIS